jgi:hypothetical protein
LKNVLSFPCFLVLYKFHPWKTNDYRAPW